MNTRPGRLAGLLQNAPTSVLTLYAMSTAFCAYFCMYAYRKPFSASTYGQYALGTFDLKIVLVISQVIGYAISKYVGIGLCSSTRRDQRVPRLILMIVLAEAALVLFALVPPQLKPVAMFLNGLPLGMVWGLLVSYLEGRRTSDLLLTGLSCSFIVSSGAVKDVGLFLISRFGISEFWMPAATGAVFLLPFISFVWLIDQVPPPTQADIEARVERQPMTAADRRKFIRRFAGGLALLLVVYLGATCYREVYDNYGREILDQIGYGGSSAIFTQIGLPVCFGVMLAMAGLNLIKDNSLGLLAAFMLMAFGAALAGASTLLWAAGYLSGLAWMVLTGLGSYLVYVPFNSVLFDRLIAATGATGTAVFAIYLSDAVGYTGSVGLQIYKALGAGNVSWLRFFKYLSYTMSIAGTLLLLLAAAYFLRRRRVEDTAGPSYTADELSEAGGGISTVPAATGD